MSHAYLPRVQALNPSVQVKIADQMPDLGHVDILCLFGQSLDTMIHWNEQCLATKTLFWTSACHGWSGYFYCSM
jgi:hypothetical protein